MQKTANTKCLIVAATEAEIKPTIEKYPNAAYFITGVGVPDTIFHLQQQLSTNIYTLVIQAGICGVFNNQFPLGRSVLVKQDCFGDIGFSENNNFTPLNTSVFSTKNKKPYDKGWLKNPYLKQDTFLPLVSAVTINQVTDNKNQIQQLVTHFNPAVESMEGAAFHYVCLMLGVPFLQIRSISNHVGERDKSKWEINKAITNLNRVLELINQPKDEIDINEFKHL